MLSQTEIPDRNGAIGPTRVDIVRSIDGIVAIADQWRALELRAADPMTYFQSLDWCLTWCRFYGGENDENGIRIATVWQAGRLVLVWPLMLAGSPWTVRRVLPLTLPHGQYGNMIVDPELCAGSLSAIVGECLDRVTSADSPDLVSFADVPASAGELRAACGEAGQVQPAGASAWMDLTRFPDWESYRQALGKTVRKGRNRRRNALQRLGEVDYVVKCGNEEGYVELVHAGVEMKQVWLKETGRATRVVNRPDFADFLSALSYDPETRSGAVAAAVMLDGRPVAVEIGFEWFDRFYSYLGSFDWDLRGHSPGKVQLEEAMRWCIERGIHAYDLLGEPSTYKSDWSNMSTPLNSWGTEPTLRGKAYASIWSRSLRPAAKTLMESAPLGVRTRLAPILERVAKGTSDTA